MQTATPRWSMKSRSMPIKHLIIVDKLHAVKLPERDDRLIISAQDYIDNKLPDNLPRHGQLKVINLCQQFGYLGSGYYCSLLADARGHRCLPSVGDIVRLNWKRIYQSMLAELNVTLNRHAAPPKSEDPASLSIHIFFGRTNRTELDAFARQVFDKLRFPLLQVDIKRRRNAWEVQDIAPVPPSELEGSEALFSEALAQFTGAKWLKRQTMKKEKFWLAILHDPEEKLPPSNKAALQKFVQVGKRQGVFVELITRKDMPSLLEFDALFIRETTAVNNHTYRFAQKAEEEGIPVIDDTASILRCCNKVYLQELLSAKRVPIPKGWLVHRRAKGNPAFLEKPDWPLVVKIPDGSFSRGVHKVHSAEEYDKVARDLFASTEVILVQEFIPSDYDWRIVLLGGEPLLACKYYMAPNHWQIYHHDAKDKKKQAGKDEIVAIDAVPKPVLQTALRAAKLIGNGLYGVDLKETRRGAVVMEINDNPNLDAGVEDKLLGDALYGRILQHFEMLVNN